MDVYENTFSTTWVRDSSHLANLLTLLSQKAGEEMHSESSQAKWSDLYMFSIS